ncbi:MAG TPA: threonine/serine dehydratase [Candidatus Polarisedimenticolia bacterium]|jgi:threonine dehydratase|nr:threonine/serine dehydratase [Candidatus Polarisedimenticolia bacterium]
MHDWNDYRREAFEAASRSLSGAAHRTPILRCATLSRRAGFDLAFKCENFQKVGAFKFRGAHYMISTLAEPDRTRGVITYSSGNHAQAVALSARRLSVRSVIVMPTDATGLKLAATRDYGAEVLQHGLTPQERKAFAEGVARERGLTMVPPYEDPRILLGQGTVLLEILQQEPGVEVVLVPVGGGGLLGGVCAAARAFRPEIEVYGVEPEVADDWARSIEAGRIVRIASCPTIADGLRSLEPGQVPFPVVQEVVRGILRVKEEEIREAMILLLTRAKIVAEPSGAVATAGALFHGEKFRGRRVVAVISGGNVEPAALAPRSA